MIKFVSKIIKYAAVSLISIFIAGGVFIMLFPKARLPETQQETAVVLGAAPGSQTLQKRTEQGIAMVKTNKAAKLVLSGGKSRETDRSEAEYMKKIVKSQLPDFTPTLEGRSNNTWENLQFTGQIIDKSHGIIIVTDRYHLARSVVTAKIQGFSEVYWSSPDSDYYPNAELYRYYFREMTALPWYILLWVTGSR